MGFLLFLQSISSGLNLLYRLQLVKFFSQQRSIRQLLQAKSYNCVYNDDTIVAFAIVSGIGALAIVRVLEKNLNSAPTH